MSAEQQYIDLFRQNKDTINSHSVPLLNALREQAYADFCRLGFPTQKIERYKYTDAAEAFAPDYGLNLRRLEFAANPYEAFRCDVPNLSPSLYFMLNDAFRCPATVVPLPQGVVVSSLAEAARQRTEALRPYYGKLARTNKDAINALNTMYAQDGLFVLIPKNTTVERPLQIVNILRSDVDLMVNRRVLIVLEDGAQACILLCDHAADNRNFLTTQVTEIFVGRNAHLELYELEETHAKNKRFSNMYVDQLDGSETRLHSITLLGGLTRNRTDISLSGDHAATMLYGCVTADKAQHVDNNTLIDHRACGCTSKQLYKYVLDGKSVGAFAGRVLVREGAQRSISDERNANLCTSPDAQMYSQPMLEIYADDVKCSHGSNVGRLDEQALFYMQQRGITRCDAQMLLKLAFVAEVINAGSLVPLRNRLLHLAEKRLKGELSRCSDCKLCK